MKRAPIGFRILACTLSVLTCLISTQVANASELSLYDGNVDYSIAPAGKAAENATYTPIYNAVVSHERTIRPLGSTQVYSWYGSELQFVTELAGTPRWYDGNSIGIEMTCSAITEGQLDTHFSVELWRGENTSNGTYIGSAALWRNGFSRAEWTNVGSGQYFFRFVKANDGIWVTSNDVAMFSW